MLLSGQGPQLIPGVRIPEPYGVAAGGLLVGAGRRQHAVGSQRHRRQLDATTGPETRQLFPILDREQSDPRAAHRTDGDDRPIRTEGHQEGHDGAGRRGRGCPPGPSPGATRTASRPGTCPGQRFRLVEMIEVPEVHLPFDRGRIRGRQPLQGLRDRVVDDALDGDEPAPGGVREQGLNLAVRPIHRPERGARQGFDQAESAAVG